MNDGYYLSTYFEINEVANVAKVSGRHDFNVSLWQKHGEKIELLHYWELERRTGLKQHRVALYDLEQAYGILNELLSEYHLSVDDMQEIWGTNELSKGETWFAEDDESNLTYHSLSHLFTAIFMDSELFYNDQIIGLAVDGGPDDNIDRNAYNRSFYCGCYINKGKMDLFKIASPGYMWMAAYEYYGLREGTLMALASASKSESYIKMDDPIMIYDKDGAREFNDIFIEYVKKIDNLTKEDEGKLFNYYDERFTEKENKISMVMKEIQRLSIVVIHRLIDDVCKKYQVNSDQCYIALSGGYALNCPTNSDIMKEYGFKGYMAPPCVNDSGMSLGIALYEFYKKMDQFEFKFRDAFYGDQDDSEDEICKKYSTYIENITEFDPYKVVEDLQEEPIVWFNSRAEIGPRALGHRSILGSPMKEYTKDRLNEIKKRQWWRPVAPIVMEEKVNEWFQDAYASPYMLHTFYIRDEKEKMVPAILHLDNSARVQTVGSASAEKEIYQILKAMDEKTGVPIICNTSLNDAKEPIINTIEEAMNFALRKTIKVMYVNGKRIQLRNWDNYQVSDPLVRPMKVIKDKEESEVKERLAILNPYHVPDDILELYYTSFELHGRYNLKKEKDVKRLLVHAKLWKSRLS